MRPQRPSRRRPRRPAGRLRARLRRSCGPRRPGDTNGRRGAGGRAARGDRHAEPRRLDRPQGRPTRRSRAQGLSRDHRQEEPADPPLFSERRAQRLFCRDRVRQRERRQNPQSRNHLDGRRQDADPGPAGDADLGQRRGPRLQARHRGRRQVHVHDHRLGRQFQRRDRQAAALWPRPAPRDAPGRRLFGAARGIRRRHRRPGARADLRQHRQGHRQGRELHRRWGMARLHRQILGLGAHSRADRADRGALHGERRRASRRTIRPTSSGRKRPSTPAPRRRRRRASSPARKRSARFTITNPSSASRSSI